MTIEVVFYEYSIVGARPSVPGGYNEVQTGVIIDLALAGGLNAAETAFISQAAEIHPDAVESIPNDLRTTTLDSSKPSATSLTRTQRLVNGAERVRDCRNKERELGKSLKENDRTSPKKPTLEKDPFSDEELEKFALRSRARVPAMIESVNQTIEDNKVPFNERRKV